MTNPIENDDFVYKYPSGAEVVLRSTNILSTVDGIKRVHTPHVILSGTGGTVVTQDDDTGSLCVIDETHCLIHEGKSFYVKEFNTLSINNYLDIQIVTAATHEPHLEMVFYVSAETEYWFYENVTVSTPGTANSEVNRNRNSATTATMTVANITNGSLVDANADTAVASATLLAHGKSGAGKTAGGESSTRQELELKPNKAYTLRFLAVAAGYVDWLFDWYEIEV